MGQAVVALHSSVGSDLASSIAAMLFAVPCFNRRI